MNEPQVKTEPKQKAIIGQLPVKKNYQKPQIIYRAPLETMAAACPSTKAPAQACPGVQFS